MKTDLNDLKKLFVVLINQIMFNMAKCSNCSGDWKDFKQVISKSLKELEIPIYED